MEHAHLETFHCTHHPVIPESDLHFTFCSIFNVLSKKDIKITANGYLIALGNGIDPSTTLSGCQINVPFRFV